MTELDERLRGVNTSQVTMKFVRDNAGKEEVALATYDLPPKVILEPVREIPLSDTDYGVVAHLEGVLEDLRGLEGNLIISWGDSGWDAEYILVEEVKEEPRKLTGEKALQAIWKDRIKECNRKQKDFDEYVRLKEKLNL